MSNLAHSVRKTCRLNKSGVVAKLWPNGQISFHIPRKVKGGGARRRQHDLRQSMWRYWHLTYGLASAVEAALCLGLSNVHNFDKVESGTARYGLKGISGLGRRRVNNACYMMKKEAQQWRLTFSTVTIPPLCEDDYVSVHQNWHKVIDYYRREMGRQLRRWGLSGEMVGVSEIQEKRYGKTELPQLHAHFVFVGYARSGGWAVTPAMHDRVWTRALLCAMYGPVPPTNSACRLESIKKDAAGYLGKYMSKGGKTLKAIADDGFEWAMPKQWWNCSRTLVRRMEKQIRHFSEGVPWLIARAREKDTEMWEFYRVVEVEMDDGEAVAVGSYGKLTNRANSQVRKFLALHW